MVYDEKSAQRYKEMCRIVGDVVFKMVADGHETRKADIAVALRSEITSTADKLQPEQLRLMKFAVELLEE